MPGLKLSAKNQETVEYLESVLKECDHFAALVEQFAAAKKNADQYSALLARELGHLRQKAMMRNQGFIADTAGQLGVAAGRSGSPMMKSRTLRDGVSSLKALVERTIKATIQSDESEKKEKEFEAAKAAKAQAEAIKKRVLEEEAKQAAQQAAAPAPKAGAAAAAPAPPRAAPAPPPRPAAAPAPRAAPPPRPQAAPPPPPPPPPAPSPRPAGPSPVVRRSTTGTPAAPGAAKPAGPGPVKP